MRVSPFTYTTPAGPYSPAQQWVKTFGDLTKTTTGTHLYALGPKTVQIAYDGDDQGAWDAGIAAVAFNQAVRGIKLIVTTIDGKIAKPLDYGPDDELAGWLRDLPAVKDADVRTFTDGKPGLLVTAREGADPKLLNELLVNDYGGFHITVANS